MRPYQPTTKKEEKELLSASKVNSFSELIDIIPKKYILKKDLNVGNPMSEMEIDAELSKLSNINNTSMIPFIGNGVYDHYIPKAVDFIASRSEFYTAYTPYQPEVSQGTLQCLYEYQSMICELTGMDIANASLYDGASAIVEGCMMSMSITKKSNIYYSEGLIDTHIEIMHTLLKGQDINLIKVPLKNGCIDIEFIKKNINEDTASIIVQSPNKFGQIENIASIKQQIIKYNSLLITSSNSVALALLRAPGNCGADIYVGEGQSFGNPMNFGGPLLGIIAIKEKYKRLLPGRVVGKTVDQDNKCGYVLTLQTREQHIRRERATSNICTNQGLLALRATIYLALMGKEGLPHIAKLSFQKAQYAASKIHDLNNYNIKFKNNFINEFVVETKHDINRLNEHCLKNNILINVLKDSFVISITEKRTKKELDLLIKCLNDFK